jgi:hypothetical protein
VQEKPFRYFGLLVAYVLPGFIFLAGIAPLVPAVEQWLRPVDQVGLGLGPPVYAVMAATAVGLIIACFRWLILDNLIVLTGVERPVWDDGRLDNVLGGFDYLVQSHYRYYEFSANALLAVLGTYVLNRLRGTLPFLGVGTDLGMLIVSAVLFAASRDALAKYYLRTGRLIGRVAATEFSGENMYNGNDHDGGHKEPAPKQPAETKPHQKPQTPSTAKPPETPEKLVKE